MAMKAVSQQTTGAAVQTTEAVVAATSYWALHGGPDLDEVRVIFRVRRDHEGAHIERFDPASKDWLAGPPSLLRYVVGGEVGADRISRAKATQIAGALGAALG